MQQVFILALLGAAAYGATPITGLKLGTDANGNGQSITNLNGITATGTVCSATITGAVHASTLTIAGKALGTAAGYDVGGNAGDVPVWFEAPTNALGLVYYTDDVPGGLMVADQMVGSFATPTSVWPLAQITNAGTAAALDTGGGSGEIPVWMAIATNWDSGWVYKINSGDDAAVRTMSMADAVGQGYVGSAATNATGDFVPDIDAPWARVTASNGVTTFYTGPTAFSNALMTVTNDGTVEYGGLHAWTGPIFRNGGLTNIAILGRPGSLLTATINDTTNTDYALYLVGIPGLHVEGMRLRGVLPAWTEGVTNDNFSYNAIFNFSRGTIRNSTFQMEVTGDGTRGGFSPAAAIHKNVVALKANLDFLNCDFITADTIESNNLAHIAFHGASSVTMRGCRFLGYHCLRFGDCMFQGTKDDIANCIANCDSGVTGIRCVNPTCLTNALLSDIAGVAADTNALYQDSDGAWMIDYSTSATNWQDVAKISWATSSFSNVFNIAVEADYFLEQVGAFGSYNGCYKIMHDGQTAVQNTGYLSHARSYVTTRLQNSYSASNMILQCQSSTNSQAVRVLGRLRVTGRPSILGLDAYTNSLHNVFRVGR